jgi:hypothetical protein
LRLILTRRGLREDETRWRFGLPGACEHWWPIWPGWGLSHNEIARALISMMARRQCSNQRPDTLMQDRSPPTRQKFSCNARPDHTCGPQGELSKGSLNCSRDARGEAEGRSCVLGSGLIKSTIQERLPSRPRPDSFVPVCRCGLRCA